MRRTALRRPLLFALALAMLSEPASASIWSDASDPDAARKASLLVSVDALLAKASEARRERRAADVAELELARLALELVAKGDPADADVGLRLGNVLDRLAGASSDDVAARGHWEAAARTYRHVAESDRASPPLRERAWSELAIELARLGRPEAEIAAYDRALELEPDAVDRARLLSNRGEARMLKGDLTLAIDDYRAALVWLAAAPPPLAFELTPSTLWGLAVALDRDGDLPFATQHVALARNYDPADEQIHGPGWFYVPAYDEAWYRALGELTTARTAPSASSKRDAYERAATAWRDYLARAPTDDRWRALAMARIDLCERERVSLVRSTRR